jgi:Fuc2NAc and GlcNAc transferase
MVSMVLLASVFILFLLLAVMLAPSVIRFTQWANISDTVSQRSAHTEITPRGGGLIFIATLLCFFLLNKALHLFYIPPLVSIIFLLALLNALLGLLDDLYGLPAWSLLLVQIILALYPALQLPLFFHGVPSFFQYAAYVFAWVWFINLFNFMDGTDGYAAQEAIFITLLLFYLSAELRVVSAVTMAACLGFLRVNYPKAKIFMGDVGSYFLGYFLFGLMLFVCAHAPRVTPAFFIISLLFTLDATYTLLKRMLQGGPFLQPHRSHWYQRLYNLGYSHRTIFWVGVMMNMILLGLALFSVRSHHWLSPLGTALSLLIIVAILILKKERCALSESAV